MLASIIRYSSDTLRRNGKLVSMPELDGRVHDELPWRQSKSTLPLANRPVVAHN